MDSFGFMFNIMGIIVPMMFLLVFGIFFVVIFRGIRQWNKNNHSPRLTVPARVIAKRANVSHHHHGTDHMSHSSTSYFVTFEVESGDRMELQMAGHQYAFEFLTNSTYTCSQNSSLILVIFAPPTLRNLKYLPFY